MNVDVILADLGSQDSAGKLNLLGAGWTQISVGPNGLTPDVTVAVFVEASWDECNREQALLLELLTEDSQPVTIRLSPDGPLQPLRITNKMIIPTPPGAPNGSFGSANLLLRFQGGLPLQPGTWYHWRVSVNEHSEDHWRVRFYVRRQPSVPSIGSS